MRLLLSGLFVSVLLLCQGQGGFRARPKVSNSLSNVSQAIFETVPGTYFAAGLMVDSLNGNNFNRLAIIGLNSIGQAQWTKKYGNGKFEYLDNTFITRSFYKKDNYIFHVASVLDSNNKYTGVLMKFDLNGDTIWQRIYRDADTTEIIIPQMLTSSIDGGFLITGMVESFSGAGQFCMLIKTDANGKELWRKKISKTSTPNVQDGKSIIQDSASKKIIIVGYQYIGSVNSFDNLLILDSVGNKLSQDYFVNGILVDLIQTKDNKFIAAGNVIVPIVPNFKEYYYSYIFKFDINNPSQHIWRYDHFDSLSPVNTFRCLKELPNGDILTAGALDTLKVANNGKPNTKVRLVKLNSNNGQEIWRREYSYLIDTNSNTNDIGVTSLELTSDGGWVAAMRVFSFFKRPFLFVKYDSTGCDSSIAYCKMMQEVGLNKNSELLGLGFEMYPNPANEKLNFIIQSSHDKKFTLKLFDISGKELELMNLEANSSFSMNTLNYKAGVYFVSLFVDGRSIETRKLVIVR